MSEDLLTITQTRSLIGSKANQRATMRSLGLRRVRHSVTQPDRPEIRGMLSTVAHLVNVSYGDGAMLGIQPGQQPKGAGNPVAGASVEDADATELRASESEALEHEGSADAASLVQATPGLTSTDAPAAPDAPSEEASAVAEPDEAGGPVSETALADPRGDLEEGEAVPTDGSPDTDDATETS
jgi:large subunit ribosomal protein L30